MPQRRGIRPATRSHEERSVYLIALFGVNIPGRELAVIAVVLVVIVAIAWYVMSRRGATGGR